MSPAKHVARLVVLWALALATVVVATLVVTAGFFPGETLGAALATFSVEVTFAVIALAGASLTMAPLRARLGLVASRYDGVALAALVVGTLALSHAVDATLTITGLREQSAIGRLDAGLEGTDAVAAGFALLGFALAPSIGEELLCRGLIQRGLVGMLPPGFAIAIAAVVFGAIHLEPIHAISAAVLGLYLGVIVHWGDSIRPAIACHLVNNTIAVASSLALLGTIPTSAASIPAGVGLAGIGLWIARRRLRPEVHGVPSAAG